MNPQTHIIAMHVIDEPGVLTKISGLFTRRGFNIDTITVGKTETKGVSRITVSLHSNEKTLEQLEKQLNKMIDVVKVTNVTNNSILRELCLITINIKDETARAEVINYTKIYPAKIVDMNHTSLIIEFIDQPEKIEEFLKKIRQFGIKELVRTGIIGISKSN
ncbi:MAG: acetolactate synthase small subunit [archaeon]|nr:acetolactate synthase small subunit [archaeon]